MWFLTSAIAAVVLGFFAAWAIALNMRTIILRYCGREPGSVVPLVGGILGAVALLTWPSGAVRAFWWVPFIVDLGSIPLLLICVHAVLRHICRRKRSS